jgi:hypothetical protein
MINNNSAKNLEKKGDKICKHLRIITIIALFGLVLCLIEPVSSFDTKKKIEDRLKYASKLQKISNNKVKIEYNPDNPDKGLSCIANDFIKEKEILFDVPKSLIISPFHIFPFKFEIMEILLSINEIKNSPQKDVKLANYLLVFQYAIYRYCSQNLIKDFIRENEYTDYYDYFEPDPELLKSFPSTVPTISNSSEDMFFTLSKFNLFFGDLKEAAIVYEKIVTEKKDFCNYIMFPAISSERYKEAIGIVKSRSYIFNYDDFFKFEGYTENNPNNSELIKKNINANRNMSKGGFLAIANYIDMINHEQPKSINGKNSNYLQVEVKKDYISYISGNNWRPGDEINVNYSKEPKSLSLAAVYGFVVKNNLFDEYEVTVKDNIAFNMEQINLCRDIGCFPTEVKVRSQILRERTELLSLGRLNENLLNYGRIRKLKGNFDYKKIYKNLIKRKFISNSNEISSYLFYFNVLKENIDYESENLIEIFREGTIKKNLLETGNFDQYDENYSIRKKWKNLKMMSNIYDCAFLMRNILISQIDTILNKTINNTSKSIKNIREKYLNFNFNK